MTDDKLRAYIADNLDYIRASIHYQQQGSDTELDLLVDEYGPRADKIFWELWREREERERDSS